MTVFEQQALKALNQIAAGTVNSQQAAAVSWLEKWAPLIGPILSVGIAVAGWWFIDRSNRRSNRDAFRLQLADAARNRILDALYDYRDYLTDVRDPSRLFRQGNSTLRGMYPKIRYHFPRRDDDPDGSRVEMALRDLALFDPRESSWLKAVHRDAWALGTKKEVSEVLDLLGELDTQHQSIMISLYSYLDQVRDVLEQGVAAGVRFVFKGRDEASLGTIDNQISGIDMFVALLQKPLEAFDERRNAHLPSG
jgi:hypothetical protein